MSIIHGLSNIDDFEKEIIIYKDKLSPNLIRVSREGIPIKHNENRLMFMATAVFFVDKKPQLIRLVVVCGVHYLLVGNQQASILKADECEQRIKKFCDKNKIRYSKGVLLIENE